MNRHSGFSELQRVIVEFHDYSAGEGDLVEDNDTGMLLTKVHSLGKMNQEHPDVEVFIPWTSIRTVRSVVAK